jgi:hypothetical protein
VKRAFQGILVVSIVLLALLAVAWLSYAPPLLGSNDYVTTATLNGRHIEASLLQPLFMSGIYYIHIPEADPRHYRWFGVAFPRKAAFSPVALYTGWRGIKYIHRDQAKGVNLLFGKIEDHWTVDFSGDGVRFTNGSLAVTLAKSQ